MNTKKRRKLKHAIKHLSDKEQKAFLKLWRETGCADIYRGNLVSYLEVITEAFAQKKDVINWSVGAAKVVCAEADALRYRLEKHED